MSSGRDGIIRREFQQFESGLRLARWAAIDEALDVAGLPPLSSHERDAVDLAAAMGSTPVDELDAEAELA